MKKNLIITLEDGRVITRDITKDAPFGKPAKDEWFANLCHVIATNGTTDSENLTDTECPWIPPSQIKGVKVKFE